MLQRRFVLWLALVAFALNALAPTLLLAAAGAAGASRLAEVCTAAGTRWVAVDDAPEEGPAGQHPAAGHCPLCSLLGGIHVAPAAPGPRIAAAPMRACLPRADAVVPTACAPPRDAPPRAPPHA